MRAGEPRKSWLAPSMQLAEILKRHMRLWTTWTFVFVLHLLLVRWQIALKLSWLWQPPVVPSTLCKSARQLLRNPWR